MDFSNDTPPKPNADLPADEGRSHFLETLGAGDDALNSLRQLREITAQNNDGVVLSSQPDDISDLVGGSVQPSRSVESQLPARRVSVDPLSESEVEPEVNNREISIEADTPQLESAPLSNVKPAAEEVDFGLSVETSEKKEEVEAPLDEPTAFPPVSRASAKEEGFVAESPEPGAVAEEEAQAEMEITDDANDSSADEAISTEKEEDEISSEAPTTLVPADPAPNEQITLSCPKCQGELTLMREHLGVEGNCVWCQLPIVAAASGANGLVRIFPLQSDIPAIGSPAPEMPVTEKMEEVAAEIATPAEPESESVSAEDEGPKVEEALDSDHEVKSEEKTPEEVGFDEMAPEMAAEVAPGEAIPKGFADVTPVPEMAPEMAAEVAPGEAIPTGFADVTPVPEMAPEMAAEVAPGEAIPKGFADVTPVPEMAPEMAAEVAPGEAIPEGFADVTPVPEMAPEMAAEVAPGEAIPQGFADVTPVPEMAPEMAAEVAPGEAIPQGFADVAPVPEMAPETKEDSVEVPSEDAFVPASEKTEEAEMPVAFDSFQSPEENTEPSFLSPTGDLPMLAPLPKGFQDSLPDSPVEEESQDVMPAGFASPMSAPVPDLTEGLMSPLDSSDEQNSAPTTLEPDTTTPSKFAGLPVQLNEDVVVPSEFASLDPTMEVDDAPVSDETVAFPATTTDPEPNVKSEAVAAGFDSPMPWGPPTKPATEEPAAEPATEAVASNFSVPAEAAKDESMAVASEPWAALPPMPANDVAAAPSDIETNFAPAQEPSGFVERKDETEAAAMSGFEPTTGLEDAPNALPPFPPASESQGISGFDVPASVQEGNSFGNLEMSEEDSEAPLSAPKMDSTPDVDFGSPTPQGFTNSEPEKEDVVEQGFGTTLMNPTEDAPGTSPFGNSPFASSSETAETAEVVEDASEDVAETSSLEKKLPPPIRETAPVNKIPEPEGPRVESKPLGSISPKKKSRKGFVIFMVILVGFVCGGALATFVLPVEDYVAAGRSYMEAKFSVEGGMPANSIDLPSIITQESAPEAPAAN